jgi:hypothetical protein
MSFTESNTIETYLRDLLTGWTEGTTFGVVSESLPVYTVGRAATRRKKSYCQSSIGSTGTSCIR